MAHSCAEVDNVSVKVAGVMPCLTAEMAAMRSRVQVCNRCNVQVCNNHVTSYLLCPGVYCPFCVSSCAALCFHFHFSTCSYV